MAKRKKKSTRDKLEDKLDDAWSLAVKVDRICVRCNKTNRADGKELTLNSHHIYGRSGRSTRWDLDNGLCLCYNCHAKCHSKEYRHQEEYNEWLIGYLGSEFVELLGIKAREARKWQLDEMETHLDYLEGLIDKDS